MLKQDLEAFLAERRQFWINKKTKGDKAKQQKLNDLSLEAEERYNLSTWLENTVREARPSITTHPSTFTHPDAKTTAIKFHGIRSIDGYLRAGNIDIEQFFDVFGNAATDGKVWDAYLFLNSTSFDGRKVIEHFIERTQEARNLTEYFGIDFLKVQKKFTEIFSQPTKFRTSKHLKQVYFPTGENYHLLSILTNSTLLNNLKQRIDRAHKSESSKVAREAKRKLEFNSEGFNEFFNLTEIRYGGAKPQNISVINSQNRGNFYLLPCIPPALEKREMKLPKTNFFKNSLRPKLFSKHFLLLHDLMKFYLNNRHARENISETIETIIDQVLQEVFKIRAYGTDWSKTEYYQSLPLPQRIWLDDANLDQREQLDLWLDEITRSFASWFINNYEYILEDNAIKLSDAELHHIEEFVREAIKKDEEFLK